MDGVVEVVAAACSRPLTRWAIIEPLLLYWQLAAAGLDLTDALPKAIEDRAADWIRRAPALYRNPPASAERLTDDLRAVMARMRLTAAEQWALAERLVLLYSDQVDYDLPAAIVQAGMIQTEGPS